MLRYWKELMKMLEDFRVIKNQQLLIEKACAFKDVDAKQYQDEVILGSFIRGIEDTFIRKDC